MKTTEPNVRQRLKVETAESHKRLDNLLSDRGPFNSAANYQWYLKGMYTLYRHCESSINWVEEKAELSARENCLFELIESDLETLGEQAPSVVAAPETQANSDLANDDASRWARAYVMEGLSLIHI